MISDLFGIRERNKKEEDRSTVYMKD